MSKREKKRAPCDLLHVDHFLSWLRRPPPPDDVPQDDEYEASWNCRHLNSTTTLWSAVSACTTLTFFLFRSVPFKSTIQKHPKPVNIWTSLRSNCRSPELFFSSDWLSFKVFSLIYVWFPLVYCRDGRQLVELGMTKRKGNNTRIDDGFNRPNWYNNIRQLKLLERPKKNKNKNKNNSLHYSHFQEASA